MGTRKPPKSLTSRKPKRAEIGAEPGPIWHGIGTNWTKKTSMNVNGLQPEMAQTLARNWHDFCHEIGTTAESVQLNGRSPGLEGGRLGPASPRQRAEETSDR